MDSLPKDLLPLIGNKKGLIIVGDVDESKYNLSMITDCKFKHSVLFYASRFKHGIDRFSFSGCYPTCDLILITGCMADFNWLEFFDLVGNPLVVNNRGEAEFTITPKFVFFSDARPPHTDSSFTRRFDVYEVPGVNKNVVKSELKEETEVLITSFRCGSVMFMDKVDEILEHGYLKTGNKFNVNFIGSKGYPSHIEVSCEGRQKADNEIYYSDLKHENGFYKDDWVNVFHSKEEGVRCSIGKDEPRVIEYDPMIVRA